MNSELPAINTITLQPATISGEEIKNDALSNNQLRKGLKVGVDKIKLLIY